MNSNVLLISRGKSFMVNAIVENLKKNGFEVDQIQPLARELAEKKGLTDVYVFYLEDTATDNNPDFLTYLKDVILDEEKKLILIGNTEEFELVESRIPSDCIAELFQRPLNIPKLVDKISELKDETERMAQRKHLLIVDDDATCLKMIRSWLQKDYRITMASSGMQAITYLAKNEVDLVLLDYEMPVTNGPQVLEMLRSDASTRSIPVIFLTGKGDRASVLKVLALKPEGYVLKTAGKGEIIKTVQAYFEKQRG